MKTLKRKPARSQGQNDLPLDAILAPKSKARTAASRSAEAATADGERWEAGALVALTTVACTFGLIQLYSASSFKAVSEGGVAHAYAIRQLVGMGIGAVVAVAVSLFDYRRLERLAWPLLGFTAFLLLLVVAPGTQGIAPEINGARRWLNLGVQFQPSEFAKLALIVWTAALALKKQDRFHSMSKGLLPFLVVWGVFAVLVLAQPNLSAVLLMTLLAALVLFAAGARIGHFILLGMIAVPVLWKVIQSADYRVRRIVAFLDPMADPDGTTFQIYQSLVAIGSGGLGGMGFGGSRQKFGFLPEPHNDFLFALLAEEWGIAGIVFTVAIFGGFMAVGYRIARRAPDRFGYLVAVGMTNLVAVSAFLHMMVALSLLPTTGISLPFMSYGRSALLAAFVAVGILLSVDRAAREAGR